MNSTNSYRTTTIAVSLPIDVLEAIDAARGDVPRSRFLTRLFKNTLNRGTTE